MKIFVWLLSESLILKNLAKTLMHPLPNCGKAHYSNSLNSLNQIGCGIAIDHHIKGIRKIRKTQHHQKPEFGHTQREISETPAKKKVH
jgi:hypothetical protein